MRTRQCAEPQRREAATPQRGESQPRQRVESHAKRCGGVWSRRGAKDAAAGDLDSWGGAACRGCCALLFFFVL
jgi:hypothetical protein